MSTPKSRVIGHCVIEDQGPSKRRINVCIEECNGELLIRPQGYGAYGAKPGHGTPIVLGVVEGRLELVCYDNSDVESPSHIIDMELARDNVKICCICGNFCDAVTAHIHQGQFIGDECCWDERLRASE